MKYQYHFFISELYFHIESEKQLVIPECFRPFAVRDIPAAVPDVRICYHYDAEDFQVESSAAELHKEVCCRQQQIIQRYFLSEGKWIIRVEPKAGRELPYRLFLPSSFADAFCGRGNWLNYLALERMLLPFRRLLLHASFVRYQGQAILFSGESESGKSTQAALWEKYLQAEVINGDKAVIHAEAAGCTAYGSPVAGSSGIYKNTGAPLAAILMVHKSDQNRMYRMGGRQAFLALYSEAVKSSWDEEYNCQLLELIGTVTESVPVYYLECTKEKEAVIYVRDYLQREKL